MWPGPSSKLKALIFEKLGMTLIKFRHSLDTVWRVYNALITLHNTIPKLVCDERLFRSDKLNRLLSVQAGHSSQAQLRVTAKPAHLKADPHPQLVLFCASNLQLSYRVSYLIIEDDFTSLLFLLSLQATLQPTLTHWLTLSHFYCCWCLLCSLGGYLLLCLLLHPFHAAQWNYKGGSQNTAILPNITSSKPPNLSATTFCICFR